VTDTNEPASDNIDGGSKQEQALKATLHSTAAAISEPEKITLDDILGLGDDTKLFHISPPIAATLVTANNPRNRKVSLPKVHHFVDLIRAGQWRATHQGGAITPERHLGDSQHRMIAIALAGQTVPMRMTGNIPFDDVLDAVDQIMTPRTSGQALAMKGVDNGELKAAIVKAMVEYLELHRAGRKPFLAPMRIQEEARRHDALLATAIDIGERSAERITDPCLTKKEAQVFAAVALAQGWDSAQTAAFLAAVQAGIATYADSPTIVLQRTMTKAKLSGRSKDRLSLTAKVALMVKGASLWTQRAGVSRLAWDPRKEGYPSIAGEAPATVQADSLAAE
jgi:hypothetical protein